MKNIELYHGTDARIIEMSHEERQQYLKDCNMVIDAIFKHLSPLLKWEKVEVVENGKKVEKYEYALKHRYEKILNEKGAPYLYLNLFEKLMMIDARNNNSGLYQYGDLYLSTMKRIAMNYSRRSFAGGETGLCAYRFIQGAEIIGVEDIYKDIAVKEASENIKEFAKEGNEKPAIVTIENIDIDYLLHENGKPLEKVFMKSLFEDKRTMGFSLRYTKPVDFNKCKVEILNEELFNQIMSE